ncbi:MAG: hypothetical protein U9N02_08380 [Campylobacterota bacterium]|nr:hypothetical protein [Campylobacterota bacterium]
MFYPFILIPLLTISLSAKEPILAILKNINSNDLQQFTLQNYSFYCRPYGIVTLEDIYRSPIASDTCKKKVIKFYIKNPKSKYFSDTLLKLFQMYHIEFKDEKCILYANGRKTLSEALVENGLAVKEPYLKDEIFKYIFDEAQKRASYHKRGLHADEVLKNCMIYYKK